jgi:uncharacterized protein DUF2842
MSRNSGDGPVQQRQRKLIGTVILLTFLAVYGFVIMAFSAGRIMQAGAVAQFVYFLIAGLAWVLPAGLLIRWMLRPDQAASTSRKPL